MDYGTQNPTCMLLWGLKNKIWYCIKEYYYSGRDSQKQKDPQDYVEDYKKFIGNLKIKQIILDPSATPLKASFTKNKIYNVRNADNDVLDGIQSVSQNFNRKQIFIMDTCKHAIREIETYVWDEKPLEHGKEQPLKQNDHACDALRYFVHTILTKTHEINKNIWR